jgi:hypothetical protein
MAIDPARDLSDPGVYAASLTRMLPYWAVVGDVMLLRDGSYEVGIEVSPPHLDSMGDAELEILHRRLMRLVEMLPPGERLRFTYVRQHEPPSFADGFAALGGRGGPASEQLHARRVEALRQAAEAKQVARRRLLVSFTYHPSRDRRGGGLLWPAVAGGAVTLAVGSSGHWAPAFLLGVAASAATAWLIGLRLRKSPFTPIPKGLLEQDLREISLLRDRVVAVLQAAGFSPRLLSAQGYMEWAWQHFNPARAAAGMRPPQPPSPDRLADIHRSFYSSARAWLGKGHWAAPVTFRQLAAASSVIRDERHLILDGYTVQVTSIDTLPVGSTVMNALGTLLSRGFPVTVVVDIVKEPRGAALRRLLLRQRLLRSVAESDMGRDEAAALRGIEKVAETQYRLVGGETDIVRVGCGVIVAAPTREEAERRTEQVVSWFSNEMQDVRVVVEDAALARTFFALAPFSGQIMPRTRAAEAENGVDFLPVAGAPRLSDRPVMPLRTRYSSVMWLDPFDPALSAWNAVLAGPTGSGKTVFAVGLALHTYSAGARVIVVDRGSNTPPGPWLTATRALQGQYIPFDPNAGISINPCDLPAGQVEPDPAKLSFLTTLISRMASEKGEALGLQERNVVQAAIRQAYLRNLRTAPDGRQALEPVFLRDIVATLRNLGAVAGTHDLSEEDRTIARRIATRLYQWVDRGRYAELVDRPSNVSLQEDWILFDTAPLAQEPELLPVAVLLITDLVWRHVSAGVGQRPTLIVLDEVWALLADPIAGDFIQDLYRRLRTTGSGVLSISQDLADFRDSEHAVAILSNAQTYYLTRAADPEYVAQLLRLNSRQARQLAGLGMAKGIYGELMVVRRLGDRQEAVIGAYVPTPQDRWIAESDAQSRLLRERYVGEYGDVLSAVEALARDVPRGMPSRPRAAAPSRTERQTAGRR